MTTTPCWNDPRIRSRERSDFVLKFDKLNNPRAMSQKKYNEVFICFFFFGNMGGLKMEHPIMG